MSDANLYALFDKEVKQIEKLPNGYGSGPAIWDYISLKVLGKKFDTFNGEEFWPSYQSDKLNNDERAVLLATYDNAFVEVAKLKEFAESCRKLHGSIIEVTTWEWNHFEYIADVADQLEKNHEPECARVWQ